MATIFDRLDEEEAQEMGAEAPSSGSIFDRLDAEEQGNAKPLAHPGQAVLPAPRPNMFANMDDEDAQAVYEAFSRHSNTTINEDGDLVYRGQVVPRPEGNTPLVDAAVKIGGAALNPTGAVAAALGTGENDIGEGLVGGGIKALRAIPTGVAAAAGMASRGMDALSDAILPEWLETPDDVQASKDQFQSDLYKGLDDALPDYNPKGDLEGGASMVSQIVGGIVFGNKLLASGKMAAPAVNALRVTVPKASNYVANVLKRSAAGAAGTTATMEGEVGTWFFDGLDGEDPNEAVAEAEKRMNIFAENFLIAAPVELLADGGKVALKTLYQRFIEPIHAAGSEAVKERILFNAAMNKAVLAANAKTPEEAAHWQNRILEILQDERNAQVFYNLNKQGVSDVDFELDVASIISRGLADDPSEAAMLVRRSFEQQRKDILEKGGQFVQTAGAVDRPLNAAERLVQETEDAFGGHEGVQKAHHGIQRIGQEIVGDELAKEAQIGDDLDKLTEARVSTMEADDLLGSRLSKMGTEPSFDIKADRDAIASEIADDVDIGNAFLKAANDGLWDEIPDGLPINRDELNAALEEAKDFLSPSIVKQIAEAHDLKSLMQMRNSLNKRISGLEGQVGFEEVVALRDNIVKSQPNFVRSLLQKGDDGVTRGANEGYDEDTMEVFGEGAGAIDAAEGFFKNVRAPTRAGVPGDIADIRSQNKFNQPKSDDLVGARIREAVTSDQPHQLDHFVKTLQMPEFGEAHEKIVQFAMADAAEKLRTKIRTEGLTSVTTRDILDSLAPYRQALRRPEFRAQAQQLNDFENEILKNETNIKGLEEVLARQTKKSSEIAEEIYEVRLKEFFKQTGEPLPSGYASMKELFSDPQIVGDENTPGRINHIIRMAEESGDPAIMEGLKSAYMRFVKDYLFTPAPTATGGRALSSARGSALVRGEDNLVQIGRQLFKGKEKVFMDALEGVLDPALDATVAKKVAGMKTAEGQAPYRKAKEAITRMVLALVGPLTRIGARMSVGAGAVLDHLDPNQASARIADAMFADRKEFLRIAEDWVKWKQPGPKNYRDIFTFLVRAGIYQDQDFTEWEKAINEAETEDQTEKAFQ